MMLKAGRHGRAHQPEDLFATVDRRFRPDQMMRSEGAFHVQHAIELKSGAEAVLKRPKDPANTRSMTSLIVEAAALSRLAHPGVPKLIRSSLDGDDPYLAMEYMDGTGYRLNSVMDDRQALVLKLTISACNALGHAHRRGLVHRDVCPANLVLSHDRARLSVIDFGLALVPGMPDLAKGRRFVGRPDFMAPEQGVGGMRLDGRADLYSLGTIAYMYLSGSSPYQLGNACDEAVADAHRNTDPVPLSSAAPWLPARVSAAVMRSIERFPERRYRSAEEFADALGECLEQMF